MVVNCGNCGMRFDPSAEGIMGGAVAYCSVCCNKEDAMFCDHHNPCAVCLPNYQPKEAVVTEKLDRCWLCAIHVKPDEDGNWNGRITDEGTIYCHGCDPERPEDIQFTERDDYDDAEADGWALASAGMGTDEDYGFYGDEG